VERRKKKYSKAKYTETKWKNEKKNLMIIMDQK
jgi:hypothetical protein